MRQQQVTKYNARLQNWQELERKRQAQLDQQKRRSYAQDQQRYWERIRQDQARLQQAQYYDNLTYNYRYRRGNKYYYTSQYGAQMLQNALNNGYRKASGPDRRTVPTIGVTITSRHTAIRTPRMVTTIIMSTIASTTTISDRASNADMKMAITAETATAITRTAITRSLERS